MPPDLVTRRQQVRTVLSLGWMDFVMKYKGSVLGYLWSLAGPVAKFGVIFTVFRPLGGRDIPDFGLYLFLGIILWEFFSQTTTSLLQLPFTKGNFLKRTPLPSILLALSVSWTQFVIFLSHALVFLGFFVFSKGLPEISATYVVFVFVQLALLSIGLGLILGSFALRFRDLRHLWAIVLQLLFWLTPIFYALDKEHPYMTELRMAAESASSLGAFDLLQLFIRFQPLSVLFFDARRAVLYHDTYALPALDHVAGVSALCLLVFVVGLLIFRYRSRYFVDEYA